MRESDFVHEIAAAWDLLNSELGLGRSFITPVSLPIDDVFQAIALDSSSSYEEIFRAGLNRSNYNILLEDYAYFQFGWRSEDAWRLGYYPNPWLSGVAEAEQALRHWETLEDLGALTYEQASDLIAELPYSGAVPPIRFEFAPAQYREFAHPAAHFHIGRHTENRWPSNIAVGPKVFALIVAKLYYPSAWAKCSSYHGGSEERCFEGILLSLLGDVRLVHDFSDDERKSFHFGKNMAGSK